MASVILGLVGCALWTYKLALDHQAELREKQRAAEAVEREQQELAASERRAHAERQQELKREAARQAQARAEAAAPLVSEVHSGCQSQQTCYSYQINWKRSQGSQPSDPLQHGGQALRHTVCNW
jgi:uncharacterized protein HemX